MQATINAKQIRLGIKEGKTISEFATEYNMTEEDFIKWVKRNYKHEHVTIMKELRRNENKKNKRAQNKKAENVVGIVTEKPSEENIAVENVSEEVELIKEVADSKTQILNEIERITKKIESDKKAIKGLNDKKEKIEFNCWEIEQEFKKLLTQLDELQKKYHQNVKEINERKENILILKKQVASYEEELANLNKKLDALEVISIYAHADGEIKCEGSIAFEEKDGWKELYEEIRDDEKYEDLTGRQLKQLSKLILFIKNMDKRYETIFEAEEIQEYFDKLVKKYL